MNTPFRTEITVQIADINYGRHLSNDAVLRLAHEARIRWLASGGFSETDIGGTGLIMTEAHIRYKKQAFHGDNLCLSLHIAHTGRAGFTLHYDIIRTADNAQIAEIDTGLAFFDYNKQRVGRMPAVFAAFIGHTA